MKRVITLLLLVCTVYSTSITASAKTAGIYAMNISPTAKINLIIILIASVVIAILSMLLSLLVWGRNRIKADKEEIENVNDLRKIFIDADDNLVFLKDENLKYILVNNAMCKFHKKTEEEIIGHDDYELTGKELADIRREADLAVLKKGTAIIDELEWDGRLYSTKKYPVRMLNGKTGIGAYIKDITEEREQEKRQIKAMKRITTLADLQTHKFTGRQEQLEYALRQSLELAESQYGYIFLYDEDREELTWNAWTNGVIEDCSVVNQRKVYQLEKTGIWGEVVRQRKPIIVNKFEKPNPLKKGYPEGHVKLKKYMSFPVIIDEKIVAVVGLANKKTDYDDNDVYEMTLLMNGVWNTVERREAQEKLVIERNKYLQALVSIGDGVMVVDREGNVEMLNHVAEQLTGWTLAEASGKSYRDIFVLTNEKPDLTVKDPVQSVLETGTIQELGNHVVLTSRDHKKFFIEDSAAPIKDEAGSTVGVVLVFRDVTDKKEQREKIEYLSFHDSLTGLYNRRFFEEELRRLDTERNCPLSIIMGDINGLKLSNDIFGHSFGDLLLQKCAEVMKRVCRSDDIIARWGGDEFVLLLPNTDNEKAQKIIERIKDEFSKVRIKAIRGSISMGAETKTGRQDSIIDILDRAEGNMYLVKTLERDGSQNDSINTIIETLHNNSVREKEHSERVSELCCNMGKYLKLQETEIRKLRDAGYLHDIGKIVLDSKMLNRNYKLANEEWNEIKRHPIVGYRILKSFDDTLDLSEPVLAHQERWDGKGYPKGLKGEEIPLTARIIAVAESYDRMINDSDDTQAMSKPEALQAIHEESGTRFDPQIALTFISMVTNNDSVE